MRKISLLFCSIGMMFALSGLGWPGAASGTVLCEANESPCSTENGVEQGASFAWLVQLPVNCVGSVSGKVTAVGGEGEAVEAEVTGFGAACNGSPICEYKAEGLPYDMQLTGSGGNGTMALSDPSSIKFKRTCFFPSSTCTFSPTGSMSFEFTGGEPAVMTATGVPVTGTPAGCATAITMRFESKMSTPQSLFLVTGPAPTPTARLCKVTSSPCPKANRYAIGTTIEASLEGKSFFEFLYEGKLREPACEGGSLTAKTTEAGEPLIGQLSAMPFSSCGAGVCAVEAQGLPYKAEIEKTTGGNGTLTLATGAGGTPKIEVNCGKSFKCIYKASGATFAFTGSGTTPKLAVSHTLERDAASEAECGASMTWKATYSVTKPLPLFVT